MVQDKLLDELSGKRLLKIQPFKTSVIFIQKCMHIVKWNTP